MLKTIKATSCESNPGYVEGFDTSTTTGPHPKALHESQILGHVYFILGLCGGKQYNIITKARLKLNEKIEGDNFFVTLNLIFRDLSPVYAFMMTVRSDSSQLDYNDDVLFV